jgi:hypothetical protein
MNLALRDEVLNPHLRSMTVMGAVIMVGLAVAMLLLGGTVAALQVFDAPRVAPIRPPQQPAPGSRRLSFDDLIYQGAFRLPAETNGDSFSFGGQTLAYKPATDTLLVGTRSGKVAEVTIPAAAKATRLEGLPTAAYVNGFRDPADGHIRDIGDDGVALDGLLVHDGRLYGTGLIYYDATHSQRLTHFGRSLDLSRPEVSRIYQVGETGKAGFVAGYMSSIPAEWRTALGGTAVTGQCCIPIVGRTSWGPSLFSWNPAELGRRDPVPVTPLLYYTKQHATLGSWEGSNEVYGGTTQMAGVAIIDGTRTVLFAGRNGVGPFCYGEGTSNAGKANERTPDGEKYCYDPTSSDKGQHAYPYRLQFWAYDVLDLAAVRSGKKEPWEVEPYGVWPFELPSIGEPHPRLGRMTYDPQRRRLFISQLFAERSGFDYLPMIHIFKVRE